ncbi:MAG: HRDC domain-containing protein, partial [Dongiaceae bacterium]
RQPTYVVFPDRTLLEMVAHRPQSLDAMAGLYGIGQTKLAKYGPAFLALLRRHSEDDAAGRAATPSRK